MRIHFIAIVLAIFELHTFTKGTTSSLTKIACQKCRSVCGSEGKRSNTSTIQKSVLNPQLNFNITAIEEIVQRKIDSAFSTRNCTDLRNTRVKDESCGHVTQHELDDYDWIVFQRRIDGSVEFFRGWTDYVHGFGDRQGEFWLGLEQIHQKTKRGKHELKIELVTDNGTYHYATYKSFPLGPPYDLYRLSVDGYSGNATDQLAYHDGQRFSTKDADHDLSASNCANTYGGAWWFKSCIASNRNARFRSKNGQAIRWFSDAGANFIRYSEMKIRKTEW